MKHLNQSLMLAAAFAAGAGAAVAQDAPTTLRIVPQSNVTLLDPIWSSAYVTRNHGYMIYDTLFGTTADGQPQPQMVETWSVSADGLVWDFTLREGLTFSDGAAVTSADVIASLKRWSSRDAVGRILAARLDSYAAIDDRHLRITLKQVFGPMLQALGKSASNVAFIMPARIVEAAGTDQITEYVGSGPFVFSQDEYEPGVRLVYMRNTGYVPRSEPANGTTGGKVAGVDRVEWVILRDAQTQLSALQAGDVDLLEVPGFELYPALRADDNIKLFERLPSGQMLFARFNHLLPPFDDVRIRQAAMAALGQEAVLRVQVGDAELYETCRSIFPCGSALSSDSDLLGLKPDPERARALLAEAGYDGTPVVLMRPTDLSVLAKAPLVAQQQLQAAGFKVDLQSMDWQTLISRRAKKDATADGGWNMFISAFGLGDLMSPLSIPTLNAGGANGYFGWQDNPALEALKERFVEAGSLEAQVAVAAEIQQEALSSGAYVPLGQVYAPTAMRSTVSGFLSANGASVYWNVTP